jgi:hypothetical protein
VTGGSIQAVAVPLNVRLRLGRAAVQTIADRESIDLLHIKGDAVHPSLRPALAAGTDIDVLVRPAHVESLDIALRRLGWRIYSTFDNGSPFGHAQTYHHDVWGYLDLHRFFPGVGRDASLAFDHLWASRSTLSFGGVSCPVPQIAAQAAILILNSARAGSHKGGDMDPAWNEASAEDRERVESEIDALDARLGFDTALGDLERHRGDRGYRLWRAVSQGGSRIDEWWGRVRAAPTMAAKVRVISRAVQVNVEHLSLELGRQPTRIEVAREFVARPVRGARELWRWFARRRA